MTGSSGPWLSLHVHCHEVPAQDALVLALADALDAGGHEWFFIRYWLHGPHLRVRVRDADAAAQVRTVAAAFFAGREVSSLEREGHYDRVPAGLREGIDVEADTTWRASGEVVSAPYVRELERYGGEGRIEAAEACFVASTRICVLVLRQAASRPARVVAAAYVMRELVGRLGLAPRFGRYGSYWADGSDAAPPALPRAAVAVAADLRRLPAIDPWLAVMGDRLRESHGGTPTDADALVVASQLHMTNNRLGIPVSWEASLGEALWGGPRG